MTTDEISTAGVKCQRAAFNLPADVAYMNCAYLGPMPVSAVAAGRRALEAKAQPWRVSVEDFFLPVHALKAAWAATVGGDTEGIALTPSASYGIAVAAANVAVEDGQTIILRESQFPSNVYVWRDVAARAGAEIVTAVPVPGQDPTEAIIEAIDERTAVVSIESCHWSDGSVANLERIMERVQAVEGAFVVDVSQAVGAVDLSAASLNADFVVGVGYKFLLGPYGLSFLWAAPHRREGRPLEHNWAARIDSEDFSQLADYRDELRPGATRYDMGQVASFTYVAAALESARMIVDWDTRCVVEYVQPFIDRIAAEAVDLGCEPVPAAWRSPHLLGLRLARGTDRKALAARLAESQVYVSVRGNSVRVSAHMFTTDADVDRLLAALAGG